MEKAERRESRDQGQPGRLTPARVRGRGHVKGGGNGASGKLARSQGAGGATGRGEPWGRGEAEKGERKRGRLRRHAHALRRATGHLVSGSPREERREALARRLCSSWFALASSLKMTKPAIISSCLRSVRQSVGIHYCLRLVSLTSVPLTQLARCDPEAAILGHLPSPGPESLSPSGSSSVWQSGPLLIVRPTRRPGPHLGDAGLYWKPSPPPS